MSYIAKKLLAFFPAAIILFAGTVFLIAPARYAGCISEGISLWAVSVLPATFPFLFLTALLTKLKPYAAFSQKISPLAGKIFGVSGAGGACALLSALSGYPVGARTVYDLSERGFVAREEVFRLACLCSTTGPMFAVGAVGSLMYSSAVAGWILLISHLIAVWTICMILRLFSKRPAPKRLQATVEDGNAMYDSLYTAVISILCVGGFIALFYTLGQMLTDLHFFDCFPALFGELTQPFLRGLLEMTAGCALLAQTPSPFSLALSCFLVTFGGACVLCQQTAYLKKAGVKVLPFLGVKLLQALLAALLCFGIAYFSGFSL